MNTPHARAAHASDRKQEREHKQERERKLELGEILNWLEADGIVSAENAQ